MWQAECLECAFRASRPTQDEAADALITHIKITHHQAFTLLPISDHPAVADDGRATDWGSATDNDG